MKNWLELRKKRTSRFNKQPEKKYKRIVSLILLLYVSLFMSSAFSSERRTYQVLENGDTLNLGGTTLTVLDRHYDQKTKEFQLNLWLDVENDAEDLFAYSIKADTISKDKIEDKLVTHVIRTDQYYFSVVTTHVPNEFTALRQTLHLSSNKLDSETPEREIKVYSEFAQTTLGNVETSPKVLKKRSLTIQINQLKEEIRDIKQESAQLDTDKKKIKTITKKIQEDLPYQVADEQEESEKKLETYQLNVNALDESIDVNTEKIALIQEKIKLLTKKK